MPLAMRIAGDSSKENPPHCDGYCQGIHRVKELGAKGARRVMALVSPPHFLFSFYFKSGGWGHDHSDINDHQGKYECTEINVKGNLRNSKMVYVFMTVKDIISQTNSTYTYISIMSPYLHL